MDSPRKKFTFLFFGTIPEIEKGIKNKFFNKNEEHQH